MKLHWDCDNNKCLHPNATEVTDGYISPNGSSIYIDLGPCEKCGNPHRGFRIWNQRIKIENFPPRKM